MNRRWNHKVVEIPYKVFGGKLTERVQQELDKMSGQGWELVSVSESGLDHTVRLFFKREG